MSKKLLLVGSNSIHTYNFIHLIEGYFDDILLLTNEKPGDSNVRSRVLHFSLKNPLNIFFTIRKVRRIVKSYQPSVIHIQQANSAAWLVLQGTKKLPAKKILTAWGSDILITPSKGYIYRWIAEQILSLSDYFTADAVFLAEKMKSLSKKKIYVSVVNFGINPVCKNEASLNGILLKKEDIIFSNRLHKKLYRIDAVIRAFADFTKLNAEASWKLIIAGEGPETESLKSLCIETGVSSSVIFVGWISQEENFTWYRKAKIFISYPESDATSVSLLEAMSAGCIPLVSDIPANHEWILNQSNGTITENLMAADFERCLPLLNGNAPHHNLSLINRKAAKEISRKIFLEIYNQSVSAP